MSSLKQLAAIWGRLKMGQRVSLVAAALATLALVAALAYFGTRPEMGVLFSDLKPEDGQAIVEKLKAANVQYELSQGGTTVSVPAERINELRLQMAGSGALSGGHVGFDIFDRTTFGATDFTQQVNYRRAIEGELAKTLEGMDEVESVRVHVTQPRESLFTEKAERAKASVILRIRQGRELARERVAAITSLVASAVEGLDAQDVAVVDTQGRVLSAPGAGENAPGGSGAFNSQIEARRRFEAETAARIVTLLEPVSGAGHVRADVAADLDFSQVEQTEEKFDPQQQVIRSQQSTQEARGGGLQPQRAGVVGARANDPVAVPGAGQPSPTPTPATTPAAPATGDQRTAMTTNYEIGRTVRRTVGGSGRIARLSVSVLVDYKTVEGVATVRTADELQKVQEVVAAAVGIDPARGDQIVVRSIPFDQPTTETRAETWMEKNQALVRAGIKYGALLLVTLLVLLFVVRPARRALRASAAEADSKLLGPGTAAASEAGDPAAALLPGEDAVRLGAQLQAPPRTVAELEAEMQAKVTEGLSSPSAESMRASTLRKQLAERAQQNPEAIAMTLRSWLNEKTVS